jgi:hypothetical protein
VRPMRTRQVKTIVIIRPRPSARAQGQVSG